MSQSRFTIQCEGCRKTETHPWHGPGKEWLDKIEEMKSRGWLKRSFGFCSDFCAYESFYAKEAQEYWDQKAFEERH